MWCSIETELFVPFVFVVFIRLLRYLDISVIAKLEIGETSPFHLCVQGELLRDANSSFIPLSYVKHKIDVDSNFDVDSDGDVDVDEDSDFDVDVYVSNEVVLFRCLYSSTAST